MTQTYSLLQPHVVSERWLELRELLARAVAHGRGELEVDDLLTLVGRGIIGVLALEEDGELLAATAFEVLHYPRRVVMNIAYTGGRGGAAIAQNMDVVYDIARKVGASAVTCTCRPAVARRIRQLLPAAEQAYLVVEVKVPEQGTIQ